MNWLYYLLEANLYLIAFYALYYLVMRRETWHQYNRAYLLGSSILAFVIPIIQLGFLKPVPVTGLPAQLVTHYSYVAPATVTPGPQVAWTRDDTFLSIYLIIVLSLSIGLAVRVTSLILLSRKGTVRDFGKWKIISTGMERGAFSFFNYLFVSADMASSDAVIAHELVHIRQKHSWDVIYLEVFRIINWFNPVAYLLQRSVKELHEFIADEAITGSKEQINTYTDFLVANAYGAYEHQLTNNLFNQSLLKKRIMMLHQKRSGNAARLKYLLTLPLLGGALCASTLAFAKDYGWIDIAPGHIATYPAKPVINNIPGTPVVSTENELFHFNIDPSRYTYKTLSAIALKIHNKGYTMNHDEYKSGDETMLKISIRKTGAIPNVGASATFRINELIKTGYIVSVGVDAKHQMPFVHSVKIAFQKPGGAANSLPVNSKTGKLKTLLYQSSQVPGKTTTPLIIVNGAKYDLPEKLKPGQFLSAHATDSMIQHSPGELYAMRKWGDAAKNGVIELYGKTSVEIVTAAKDTSVKSIEKKIDSIVRHKSGKIINRQLDSLIKEHNDKIDRKIKSEIQQQKSSNKLPPPSWAKPEFSAFSQHLGRYTRYPAKEWEQKTVGNVVIRIILNSDHKIADVELAANSVPDFDNEVIRAAKLYTDAINYAPGTYIVALQFFLSNEKQTKFLTPSNIYSKFQGNPKFVSLVEVAGFFKE
ncbi:MAG: hypothetical protein JSU01_13275 [Bacteroidetes bacterium]|nr:hypothetical protein [Bacteroidota bacterium]